MNKPGSGPNIDALHTVQVFAVTSKGKTVEEASIYSEAEGLLEDIQIPEGQVITSHWIKFASGRRADVCPSCHRFILREATVYDPDTGATVHETICANHPECGGPYV